MHPYAIYRRCPNCQAVSQASAFRRGSIPFNAPGRLQRRTCPACDHIGLLAAFPIVERPTDQGEAS
jgi:hypothetical protein